VMEIHFWEILVTFDISTWPKIGNPATLPT
jgi:hypothetical protein